MKTSVNFYDFERAFVDYSRTDNFSYAGLKALFDWFEQYEEDCETEVELDVIAICCEYSEYNTIEEFRTDYGEEYETMEDINDATLCIMIDDESFIIQQF